MPESSSQGVEIAGHDYLRLNWPDLANQVQHLVYGHAKEYIVFIDKEMLLDWQTSDEFEARIVAEKRKSLNEMLNLAASVECIPSAHHKKSNRFLFKRMIGEGIARALSFDFENSREILTQARSFILMLNREASRVWYLATCLSCMALMLIIGTALWVYREPVILRFGLTCFLCMLASCSGGVGAFISVFFRLGKAQLGWSGDILLHIVEGVSRIIVGSSFAAVAALSIKMGLVIPIFANTSAIQYAMILAGFLAGASERWGLNLIGKFEENSSTPQ